MMVSKVEVVSDAFVLLGKAPVNSVGPDSPPVVAAVSKLFDLIYPNIISMHPWKFAMGFTTLSPLAASPPIDKYQYAYLLPADLLHLRGTYPVSTNYARYENYIYTNAYPTLTIEYYFLPEISRWPVYFQNLMVLNLAAYAALPVTQDVALEQIYSQKALQYFINARSLDDQQQPSPSIARDPVWSRKFG